MYVQVKYQTTTILTSFHAFQLPSDHGPFQTLNQLWAHPAYLAVFMNYIISNCGPATLVSWECSHCFKYSYDPKHIINILNENKMHECALYAAAELKKVELVLL